MKTAIQELIHFIEKDRMQSTYTKEQILELLNFKLEKEKEQIYTAWVDGFYTDWRSRKMPSDYYNETFKSE